MAGEGCQGHTQASTAFDASLGQREGAAPRPCSTGTLQAGRSAPWTQGPSTGCSWSPRALEQGLPPSETGWCPPTAQALILRWILSNRCCPHLPTRPPWLLLPAPRPPDPLLSGALGGLYTVGLPAPRPPD